MIKENRSTDELFGTFPGVHNYCQGGHSPLRQTTNQSISCTGVGTRSGNGWCEPIECITPNDPEGHCSIGDTCPQITVGTQSNGTPYNLVLEDPTVTYVAPPHQQSTFISELDGGKLRWAVNSGGLAYFTSAQIPFYYSLASAYGLADNHFETVGGFSMPNHAYLVAASSNEGIGLGTAQNGQPTDPGSRGGFLTSWTCGARHSGTSTPYTYAGTFDLTAASDGTRYYGGTCTNHPATSCTCKCAAGKTCNNTFDPTNGGTACSTDPGCTALNDTCSTQQTIGGTSGAPCLTLTTIFDRIEAVLGTGPSSWAYYSLNSTWNGTAYFQNIYFDNTRWNNHVHQDTQFDIDAGNCTGMCSNNHATACSLDAQCGSGGTCIDSDGTPPGSKMCTLPKVSYLSATPQNASDHDGQGPMHSGELWTQARLTAFFNSPYVYNHSVLLLTWDDWGGYWDHVPPPVEDNIPTLGFRVPLICVGPYCRNKITHTQFEFASVLKCMEGVFGLTNINSRDAGAIDVCAGTGTLANNTDGMVNLSQTPIPAFGQASTATTTSAQSSLNPSTYQQEVTFTANVTSSSSGTPTGSVIFLDGGSPIGSNSLSQGNTSVSRSDLVGGTHSITAAYSGDPIFAPSSSSALSQVINPAVSSATLQSSQNSSSYGLAVILTATISGGGVTPTGNVIFYDGTTSLGTTPVSNGQATFTTSSLSVGSHSITADYGGDSNYSSSTSAALIETINTSPTSTALTSSLNPSVYNLSITFTANVTSTGGRPTGSVAFNDGSTTLATTLLVNGTATLNYPSLAVGPHSITASYSGDSNFQSSASASLTQTINQATTSTALASNVNPSSANQSVTFTAIVTSQYGGALSGSVTFKQGTTSLQTATLTNGQASYATSFSAGTLAITATYNGDANNQSSTSAPLTQTVNLATTSTALTSNFNPSSTNQSVTLIATVTSQYGGALTGNVTFKQGTTPLSTVSLANGQASYTTSFNAGTYSITATYSGDSNNQGSTSPTLSQKVNQATTSTALVSSLNPSYANQSVTLTATVTSQYGEPVNGSVTFKQGTTPLSTAPLSNSQAAYATTYTSSGTRSITAAYSGDNNNLSSTSPVVNQVVKSLPAPTTTALTSSLDPSFFGQSVTFTATVTSPYGPIPDGHLVTFFDGNTTLGSAPTASGVATYTSSLSADSHVIKATFVGDAIFASSTKSLSQVVKRDPTTIGLASSLNPSNSGQSVTFTATVTSTYGPIPDGELVTFYDGSTTLGSAPLGGGVAAYSSSSLTVASHAIKAAYPGDAAFASSSKTLTQVVKP